VETVLALGIVSFGMISVLGVLPVGLRSFRMAITMQAKAEIVREISSDVLQGGSSSPRYFSENGLEVDEEAKAIFTATVEAPVVVLQSVTTTDLEVVLIKVKNSAEPDVTNTYPIILPPGF
jgi:uncharacterized protein (TIGR02598 family)